MKPATFTRKNYFLTYSPVIYDFIFKIDEHPMIIYELNENAANAIYNENFIKASKLLLKAEQILDQFTVSNTKKNNSLNLLTLHNLALCYQK
jgi:hypothetical protein